MSKILGLQIQGLRKIKMAELDLSKGNLIQIRGRNQAGKSTILLAAEILFGGKGIIPEDVITHGAEKAQIIGTVDDFTIKRIIRKNGSHSLSVEKDGMVRTKPQDFLNTLAGKFLDPQWFSELTGPEMKKVLMKHLGIDFTQLDKKLSELEAQRRFIGREIKSMGEPVLVEQVATVSLSELLEERQKIDDYNREQDELEQSRENAYEQLGKLKNDRIDIATKTQELEKRANERIKDIEEYLEKQIIALKHDAEIRICDTRKGLKESTKVNNEKIKVIKDREVKGELYLKELPAPSLHDKKQTNEIEEKIAGIEGNNRKADDYKRYLEKRDARKVKDNAYEKCTSDIKKNREEKERMLIEANMPIEGLEIIENGLSFNDINNENWSDSESLKVAMYISASLSNDLKTMFIKRGESLDSKSLEEVKKFADEKEYQVIIEIVDDQYDLKDDNIFYIEDGKVLNTIAQLNHDVKEVIESKDEKGVEDAI